MSKNYLSFGKVLTDCSPAATGEIIIPDDVDIIDKDAFSGCDLIESVVIPDSVEVIRFGAFSKCSNLKSIKFGNGLKRIDALAFDCDSLESIVIPASVEYICDLAFCSSESLGSIEVDSKNKLYDSRDNCNAIIETSSNTLILGCASSSIPEGVTVIGHDAFSGCSDLVGIWIPDSVTSIGDWAFSSCDYLDEIRIPKSVATIGNWAFEDCTSLAEVVISNGVTRIGNGAFGGCSSLESIVVDSNNKVYDSRNNCNAIIHTESNTLIAGCKNTIILEGVTKIGEGAFSGCTSLTSIVIPDSVTEIGRSAFWRCESLKKVSIPEGVTEIGDEAFGGCSSLESIVVDSNNKVYDSRNNCNAIIHTESNTLIAGCKNTIILEGVTRIADGAFRGCSSLTEIVIPESVTWIGNCAFWGCSSLKKVSIPERFKEREAEIFGEHTAEITYY